MNIYTFLRALSYQRFLAEKLNYSPFHNFHRAVLSSVASFHDLLTNILVFYYNYRGFTVMDYSVTESMFIFLF